MNNFKIQNFIFNWNRVNDQVEKNYKDLKSSGYNISVINSSDSTHKDWINLGDDYWLYGQFYQCLENFDESYDYLNIFLGDVEYDNYCSAVDRVQNVLNQYNSIGIYAPEYQNKEKCNWIIDNVSVLELGDGLVASTMADFFHICIHKDIALIFKRFLDQLTKEYPDFELWKGNGGGLDLLLCSISHILKKLVVRDKNFIAGHGWEYGAADLESHQFYIRLMEEFNKFLGDKNYLLEKKLYLIGNRAERKITPNINELWNLNEDISL